MATIAGITFAGYLDTPEEMLSSKRRCLYICDDATAAANLPTTEGLELPDGSVTAAPAPGSIGIVIGGDTQALKSTLSWGGI